MKNKNGLNSFIPNPFETSSNLSNLDQKAASIKEASSLTSVFGTITTLLTIGIVLLIISTPFLVVLLLIGGQIAITVWKVLLSIQKIKSLQGIDTSESSDGSLQKIISIDASYEKQKSRIGLLISVASFIVIFLGFQEAIQNVRFELNGFMQNLNVWYFLLPSLYYIYSYAFHSLSYSLYSSLPKAGAYSEVNKRYQVYRDILAGIPVIAVGVLLVVGLILLGAPWWITALTGSFILLLATLSFTNAYRIANTKTQKTTVDTDLKEEAISTIEGEKVEGAIYGISRQATSFLEQITPSGYSVAGAGRTLAAENTLVITNKRLLFIQVMVDGGNSIVGDTNYSMMNFYFNRGAIKEAGENLLKKESMKEITELALRQCNYEDIKLLKLDTATVYIEKTNGKKMKCGYMDKEYFETTASLLKKHLGDRFVQVNR